MRNSFKLSVTELVLIGIFAALSAALSQLAIPIGTVPVTMTHVSVFLAAGLLGVKSGTLSQCIFVLMGALGLPVFAYFSGGLGIVAGPTGGFIIGYIACVFITALIQKKFGKSFPILILSMICGIIVTYLLGLWWLVYSLNLELIPAITAYALPFIPGDILKISLCALLIRRLDPIVNKKINAL